MSIPTPPPYPPASRRSANPLLLSLVLLSVALGVTVIVLAWLLLAAKLDASAAHLEAAEARAEMARIKLESEQKLAEMSAIRRAAPKSPPNAPP